MKFTENIAFFLLFLKIIFDFRNFIVKGALGALFDYKVKTRFVVLAKFFENKYKLYTIGKSLKFGVFWFLNYENRLSGSKDIAKKPKKIDHFWENPIF